MDRGHQADARCGKQNGHAIRGLHSNDHQRFLSPERICLRLLLRGLGRIPLNFDHAISVHLRQCVQTFQRKIRVVGKAAKVLGHP